MPSRSGYVVPVNLELCDLTRQGVGSRLIAGSGRLATMAKTTPGLSDSV